MRGRTTMLAMLMLVTAAAAGAERLDVSPFFGYYEGVAMFDADTDGTPAGQRDLTLEIRRYGSHGFTVAWTTVTHRADGNLKRSESSVNFEPESRTGVYGAAMRRTLFGEQAPLDPLKGDPFVWATVSGDTLTVHSLVIIDDGGWEMQSYVRRLTPTGLALDFQRVRNGAPLRTLSAELRRTAKPKDR